MEQTLISKADLDRFTQPVVKPKDSQESITGVYPKQLETSPHLHNPFL
jgi:hypothetical protein